ncbi:hypothetical protein GQ85_01840 [Rhodococcus rhodochrous]|nr:hypothetical protein GQ85_01840 [Rhodococcus rhodochrous]
MAHVGDAVERDEAVLAREVHRDVADEDEFLMARGEGLVEDGVGDGVQAGEHLPVRPGDRAGVSGIPSWSGPFPAASSSSRTTAYAQA